MNYIVIDLEFNQAFQPNKKRKSKVIDECPFEIIQIGAVKLDSQLNITQTADFLIKPELYPKLHPYVEKLTELKIEVLNRQQCFPDVFDKFIQFISSDGFCDTEYVFCTWGGADVAALYKNVMFYKLDLNKITNKYINVQEMAATKLQKPKGMSIGLKSAVNEFGLEENLSFHSALNDAIYTARIFKLVYDTERQIKAYTPGSEKASDSKNLSTDVGKLYNTVEREFGRKLSKKERKVILKVYFMGRSRQFECVQPEDIKNAASAVPTDTVSEQGML